MEWTNEELEEMIPSAAMKMIRYQESFKKIRDYFSRYRLSLTDDEIFDIIRFISEIKEKI